MKRMNGKTMARRSMTVESGPPSREPWCGCLCQNFDNRLVDRVFGDKANDLFCNLSVLEYEKCGDSANAVAHRRCRVAVYIHLHNLEFAVILIGNFVDNRGQGSAGTAPCGPKIYKYGLGR